MVKTRSRSSIRMKLNLRAFRAILVVTLLLVLISCGDTQAVKKITAFSDATKLVTKSTNDSFDLIEQKYEEAQIAATVVNYNSATFNPNTPVKVFFPEDDLKARKLVLDALGQYAANLAAIMSNDKLDEFDAKTKALGTALTDLNDSAVKDHVLNHQIANATDIRIFTTALRTIGEWFVHYRRQKIVRENVEKMRDAVRTICQLLREDFGLMFDPDDPSQRTRTRRGLRAQLWNEYTLILNDENTFIIHNETRFTPGEKRDEIKKLIQITGERKKADETIVSIQAALNQLADTHDQLLKAFDKQDQSLGQMISQLFSEGERIKAFYDDLAKK